MSAHELPKEVVFVKTYWTSVTQWSRLWLWDSSIRSSNLSHFQEFLQLLFKMRQVLLWTANAQKVIYAKVHEISLVEKRI